MNGKVKGTIILAAIAVAILVGASALFGIDKARDNGPSYPTAAEFTEDFGAYLTEVIGADGSVLAGLGCQTINAAMTDTAPDGSTGSFTCLALFQGANNTQTCVGLVVTLLPDGTIPPPEQLLSQTLTPADCA